MISTSSLLPPPEIPTLPVLPITSPAETAKAAPDNDRKANIAVNAVNFFLN